MRSIVRCVNDHFIVYFTEIESSLPTFVNILANNPTETLERHQTLLQMSCKTRSGWLEKKRRRGCAEEQLLLTGIEFSSFLLLLLLL
ncbi:hypothetical protein T01_14949 [Trichinella spiralis]|uniref:Uncharacterized protein n=1 Tax=Trichinella spiralis TaxID=6334 RepID=A0A0V1BCD6_TRISP|nr:hypothetical protein T01_14949 [Trichinella spiralis]